MLLLCLTTETLCVRSRTKTSATSADIYKPLKNLQAQVNRNLARDIAELQKTFGQPYGFQPLQNKRVTLDFKHTFGIGLSFPSDGSVIMRGLHHDFDNRIEHKNILTFEMLQSSKWGGYRSRLSYREQKIGIKNFFPTHWPRKKVVRKIREAYNDFTKSGRKAHQRNDGIFEIQGRTNEGININMFVNDDGVMITAYPAQI